MHASCESVSPFHTSRLVSPRHHLGRAAQTPRLFASTASPGAAVFRLSSCLSIHLDPQHAVRYAHFATAALRTCVRKKPPFVRSMTCWYTLCGGWFMTTVPAW